MINNLFWVTVHASFQLSPWSREASKLNSEDLDTLQLI